MKQKQDYKYSIKSKFKDIQDVNDLLELLNYANKILNGKKSFPLKMEALYYYASPKSLNKKYNSFKVNKKNGGFREIHAPVQNLKNILKPLNLVLQSVSEPHKKATGFVTSKSIKDNAMFHVGNHYVYNIDLKDFFHSFVKKEVKNGFLRNPFNLKGTLEPIAHLLASLCTHTFELDGKKMNTLPQGAPTSPTITNILCKDLDNQLDGLANRFKIKYSRYADDITFSSKTNVFKKQEFLDELNKIISRDHNLVINPSKTRLQKSGFRQEVTGLIVNEKVNVNNRFTKQLRMWLYYWEKYGYKKAESIFIKDYTKDKLHLKQGKPNFTNVLIGKLEYFKMIKGVDDPTYKKFNQRFERLIHNKNHVDKILEEWELNGIDQAILKYYNKPQQLFVL